MTVRAASTALLVAVAVALGGCGGSSAGGPTAEEQTSIEAAVDAMAEHERAIFPNYSPEQKIGYREAFLLCTRFIQEDYDYTAVSDYMMARDNAPIGSVGFAERTGCSDANADDPLPGSGFTRRDP